MLTNFKDKVVLITGITGFKGSWLAAWLLSLGAKVVGFADCIPTQPSHFSLLGMESRVCQIWGDICHYSDIFKAVELCKPDYIFHLAAQSLVRKSYSDPLKTFLTNTIGTLNIMEAVRSINRPVTMVLITSDKCYENVEKEAGYVESDRLGGKDPYSGSKAAAEVMINSYFQSFFLASNVIRLGVARAGNVIGGGDWSEDRIIPDAVRAWSNSSELSIRFPESTRPWQHVLEPLSGYLSLALFLDEGKKINGQAFNFGPMSDQNFTVSELLRESQKYWPNSKWSPSSSVSQLKEAGLLRLSCDKALTILGWAPILTFQENILLTINWYKKHYEDEVNYWNLTQRQIQYYEDLGIQRGAVWA